MPVWAQWAGRAAKWAAVWALLAAHERIDERNVDVPVPQIAAKIPEVVETIPQEHISDDLPEPQVVKENLEVIKVSQERVQQRSKRCASIARRDRRVGEVGLTGTRATRDRRGDGRFGESGLTETSATAERPSKLRTFLSFGKRSWG